MNCDNCDKKDASVVWRGNFYLCDKCAAEQRVIDAAPELLAALKRLVAYGDVFSYKEGEQSPYAQASAAIHKAEGRKQ